MIHLDDIHSLSEFQRNAKGFVRKLKRSRNPAVLTVNGRAELVVQDARSYQALLERLDRLEAIEAIREGLESVKQGKGLPLDEAMEHVRRKLKLPSGPWSTGSA